MFASFLLHDCLPQGPVCDFPIQPGLQNINCGTRDPTIIIFHTLPITRYISGQAFHATQPLISQGASQLKKSSRRDGKADKGNLKGSLRNLELTYMKVPDKLCNGLFNGNGIIPAVNQISKGASSMRLADAEKTFVGSPNDSFYLKEHR
jgi:hypothetical protein